MEGGLGGALLLLALAALAAGSWEVTTYVPLPETALSVSQFTATLTGYKTVTLFEKLGVREYIYVYTEPLERTFVAFCKGNATLVFTSPAAAVAKAVSAEVQVGVTTVTSTTTVSLPSPFYYLLGGTESESVDSLVLTTASSKAFGEEVVRTSGALVGTAVVVPKGTVTCSASPPPATLIALYGNEKVTSPKACLALTEPTELAASADKTLTVTATFPTSLEVYANVTTLLIKVKFFAERPRSSVPALALLALLVAAALRKRP